MAKIRDVARITPFRKVTQMTTPAITKSIRPRGNANNAGFKQWLADRHNEQLNLQDIILVALTEIEQPVSTQEMQAYLKNEGGMDLKDYRVKYALDQLVSAGKASVHLEDDNERTLRANGVPVTPKPAYLFNAGPSARRRTVASVVDGYTIFDPRTLAGKPKPRKTQVNVNKPIGAPDIDRSTSSQDQNAAIDYLVEKIVAERTKDLQAQLNEANAKLAQFKKLLS